MIDFAVLREALYSWATSVLGSNPVVWYYPNAPRPQEYYTTLFLSNMIIVGQDYVGQPTDSEIESISGNREFTLTAQSYGGDVMGRMETLRTSLQKPSVQAALRASNIVTINSDAVIDLTDIVNTGYEPRASVDMHFRIAQTTDDENGLIQAIEGNYEYNDAGELIDGSYAIGEPYIPSTP